MFPLTSRYNPLHGLLMVQALTLVGVNPVDQICDAPPDTPDAKRLAIYVNLAFVRAMLELVHGSPFGGRRWTRLPNGVVNACLTGLCLKCRMPLPREWVSKLNRL